MPVKFSQILAKDETLSRVQQNISNAFLEMNVQSISLSKPISLTANQSYTPSPGKYAIVQWTKVDNTDTVAGVSASSLGLSGGVPLYLGNGTSIICGAAAGVHFFGIEFQNI